MEHQICSEITRQLPFLLHGELSQEERRSVVDHLSACAQCQHAYERFHKTFELVKSYKEEPENFEAFNQTLFRRIQEGRATRAFVLKPSRFILRPAILTPILYICLVVLVVGLWRRFQEPVVLVSNDLSRELAVLDGLNEQVPGPAEEIVAEEALLLDDLLLVDAGKPSEEVEILRELEFLDQVGEEEGMEGQGANDLEQELLSIDEDAFS